MRHILRFLVLVFFCAPAFAGAPASLAGKVYRDSGVILSARGSWERTIILRADGTCSFLLNGGGSALVFSAAYKTFFGVPPGDGTYTRTSDTTATLLLYPDGPGGGTSLYNLQLTFTTDTSGLTNNGDPVQNFSLADLSPASTSPTSNVSMRGHVGNGQPLVVGFVIPGTQVREVLIRVVGPSLAQFGITGAWADPDFQLYAGSRDITAGAQEVHYADWTVAPFNFFSANSTSTMTAFQKVFDFVGAFPLLDKSKDAAQIVRLGAGAYTIVCSAPAADAGGEALVEVYFLP